MDQYGLYIPDLESGLPDIDPGILEQVSKINCCFEKPLTEIRKKMASGGGLDLLDDARAPFAGGLPSLPITHQGLQNPVSFAPDPYFPNRYPVVLSDPPPPPSPYPAITFRPTLPASKGEKPPVATAKPLAPTKRVRSGSDVEIVSTSTKKSRGNSKGDKENQGAGKLETDDEVFNGRWSDSGRQILFTFLLGPNSDSNFEKLKKNPTYIYKKVWHLLRLRNWVTKFFYRQQRTFFSRNTLPTL
jgi:hypothetical protein